MDTTEAGGAPPLSRPAPATGENDPSAPFPLIVGITGHNDPEDDAIAPVSAAVRALLLRLQARYPHTPIQVMSALAEGADQLAAQEALALGIELVALLPMPLADYAATFATDAGRLRLHDLWARAQLRIALPCIVDAHGAPDAAALQYEHAGLTIARYSHVLLALWNGLGRWDPDADAADRRRQQGGTAHVVYLRGASGCDAAVYGRSALFPTPHSGLEAEGHGLTFRVATPRRKTAGCVGEPGSLWRIDGNGGETLAQQTFAADAPNVPDAPDAPAWPRAPWPQFERRAGAAWRHAETELDQLDDANARVTQAARDDPATLAQSAEHVLPAAAAQTLGARAPAVERIRRAYACADVFSQTNQRAVYRTIWGICLAVPGAVLAFELYAHHWTVRAMLLVYLAVIFIPLLAYRLFIKRRAWQNHFQDFRALAEALRVQLFWGLAGVPRAVGECYLRKHRHEMDWIRQALLGPALQSLAVALGPPQPQMVMAFWIDAQCGYFSGTTAQGRAQPGKAEQNRRTHRRCAAWTNAAYATGLAIGVGLFAAYDHLSEGAHHLAIMAIGLAPAIAAAISIFSEKRAFRDHAHQYDRMGRLFGAGALLIRRDAHGMHDAPQAFAAIVGELGAEALAENGDWLMAHRERQVEPIKGG